MGNRERMTAVGRLPPYHLPFRLSADDDSPLLSSSLLFLFAIFGSLA